MGRNKRILVGLTDFEMANKLYNINGGFNGIVIDNTTTALAPENYTIGCLNFRVMSPSSCWK